MHLNYTPNSPTDPHSVTVPTLNQMGYMFKDLTEYDHDFISFSEKSHGPVLELGAAFGYTTLKVADKGIPITANDLDPNHLRELRNNATIEQSPYLTLKPGRFPSNLDFPSHTFTAILSSNMFHYLTGDEIEEGILNMYSWLKPGGKAFVITASPYAFLWQEFIPLFEERHRQGMKWPGYTADLSIFKNNKRFPQIPKFIHFLNIDILSRAFSKLGFIIEKSGYCPRSSWPIDFQLDGRESVGLIAVKPDKP